MKLVRTAARLLLASMVMHAASALRPGEDLDWGDEDAPDSGFNWFIRGGLAKSEDGLGEHDLATVGMGGLYRLAREANIPMPIVFGVFDDAGEARVGGIWGTGGVHDITYQGEAASITLVGMTEQAEVQLAVGSHHNNADPTGTVRAYNIGIRGGNDSFVMRANGGYDLLQLEGCWWLDGLTSGGTYASGIHTDKFKKLIIKNHKWRGKQPSDPGLNIREHAVAYIKAGSDSILLENNNFYGGNRSGFQIRPDALGQRLPGARVMVRGNFCTNCGDNFVASDGGAVMTSWVSSNGMYVYDNVIDNFRYQALVISGQSPEKNFPFLASGNQHKEVYVAGNAFTPGPLTERSTMSLSSIDYLAVTSDNYAVGRCNLDSVYNVDSNGTWNVLEEFYFMTGGNTFDFWRYGVALTLEEYRSLTIEGTI